MLLTPVYFAADASSTMAEEWRRRVRVLYYKFLEELGDERKAFRRAAQAVGYSEHTMRQRRIKKQAGPKLR